MAHKFMMPFTKLQFGVEDLTKTYERILGPIDLFAPVNGETVTAEKKFELERPVTPINSEIKKAPRVVTQLLQLVRRRIQPRPNVQHLANDDQVHLADVIIAAVNNAWPSVQSLAEDPSLTPENNQELLRRISVHIVTVCQTLYEHYLLKAEILNKRGVFSSEANMSRLKTQLFVDADKFLNVLTIRRYILADLTHKTSGGENGTFQAPPEVKGEKLPSHLQLIHDTHAPSTVVETPENNTQRAIEQMLREMPTLNSEKLYGVLASLPDFSFSDSSDLSQTTVLEPTKDQSVLAHRKTSQDLSHDRVLLKRSNSCAELVQVDNLADDLNLDIRGKKQPQSATGQRERTSPSLNVEEKNKQSKLSRCEEDLQRLIAVRKDSTGDSEDLAPLLQAVIRNAKHDNKLQKLKEELRILEERERQRDEQERLNLPATQHVQPATVTKQLSDSVCVRTSDMRVSERTCLSSVSLQRQTVMYNDLNNEIDSKAVKEMDRTLRLEDEIGVIYDEMLKTMSKDHLNIDSDSTYMPAVEDLNLSCAMASSSLVKNRRNRVVNRNLQRVTQPYDSTSRNEDDQVNKLKYHSSWLDLWKQTINSDDYIKYLSTKGSDYMGAIFRLYNSDDDSSADSDEETASKSTHRVREKSARNGIRNGRLAELQALKSEYSAGQWNVNCVMLGGLGRDPPLDNNEYNRESVESQNNSQNSNSCEMRSARENRSYIVNKKQRRLEQERLERDRIAASQPVVETPIQDRLELLWTALQMPDSLKLDMALKYSSDQYHSLLTEAVSSWQSAVDLIVKREKLIKKLESFERLASRPARLVSKGSSTDRLPESQMRSKLNKNISAVDVVLKRVLMEIQTKYGDVITYQGRPYLDKMRCDRVEMLYWLQEERKVNALYRESRARCLPSLPVYVTAICPTSVIFTE